MKFHLTRVVVNLLMAGATILVTAAMAKCLSRKIPEPVQAVLSTSNVHPTTWIQWLVTLLDSLQGTLKSSASLNRLLVESVKVGSLLQIKLEPLLIIIMGLMNMAKR